MRFERERVLCVVFSSYVCTRMPAIFAHAATQQLDHFCSVFFVCFRVERVRVIRGLHVSEAIWVDGCDTRRARAGRERTRTVWRDDSLI